MPRRPRVLVNMAMTADGKIDTVARQGARISGVVDSARVDDLRASADAVLVGGHTLIQEDPRLTVRNQELIDGRVRSGRPSQPTKVGVVSCLRMPGEPGALPAESRFLVDGGGRVVVFTTSRTPGNAIEWLASNAVEVFVHDSPRVDLRAALDALGDAGTELVMVEGGSTLVAALLREELVDEIRIAIAPIIFGGETAPTPVGGPGWSPQDAPRLTLVDRSRSDEGDMVLRYIVSRRRGSVSAGRS